MTALPRYREATTDRFRFMVTDDYGKAAGIVRTRFIETPWFTLGSNLITTPRRPGPPHNHARGFVSIPLTGGYVEEQATSGGTRLIRRRRFVPYFVSSRVFHRIHDTPNGPCRTVIIYGIKRKRTLGFLVDGEWMEHNAYIDGLEAGTIKPVAR